METILTTLLEDAWYEVQNMCDTWVYEELGAEIDRLTEQLNSKQDALSAALLTLDNAVEQCVGLEAELARYKQGVKVETIVHSNGSSWAGFDAYVHVQVPLAWSQQRVRVLVMKVEE